ncbi:unnamed protein product, partial [Allacma fusca]
TACLPGTMQSASAMDYQ